MATCIPSVLILHLMNEAVGAAFLPALWGPCSLCALLCDCPLWGFFLDARLPALAMIRKGRFSILVSPRHAHST
jgi:hypothetical protein